MIERSRITSPTFDPGWPVVNKHCRWCCRCRLQSMTIPPVTSIAPLSLAIVLARSAADDYEGCHPSPRVQLFLFLACASSSSEEKPRRSVFRWKTRESKRASLTILLSKDQSFVRYRMMFKVNRFFMSRCWENVFGLIMNNDVCARISKLFWRPWEEKRRLIRG